MGYDSRLSKKTSSLYLRFWQWTSVIKLSSDLGMDRDESTEGKASYTAAKLNQDETISPTMQSNIGMSPTNQRTQYHTLRLYNLWSINTIMKTSCHVRQSSFLSKMVEAYYRQRWTFGQIQEMRSGIFSDLRETN